MTVFRKSIRGLRGPLETGAFFAGMTLAPLLPRPALLRMAAALGKAGHRLDRRSGRIGRANLQTVFPEAGGDERNAVLREAFQTVALTMLDLFWFSRHCAERLRRHVLFEPSCDPYFRNAPVIAVCAHFGNWEVLGQAVAARGCPSVSVAAPLRNRRVDRMLQSLRGRTGQTVIPRAGAARGLMRALRNRQRVALLIDQNTRITEGGIWTNFFGLPAPVSGIAEMLARRAGAPVIPIYGYRQADGNYRAEAGPVLPEAGAADTPGDLTAALMRDLETRIRRHPGQWLWMYKRWKYIPADIPAGRYPFYARPIV